MEKGRLREALRQVLSISKRGNQHMQSEEPWVLLKGSEGDKVRGATAIGVCCQLVALVCALLAPYMPDTCRTLREQLNVDSDTLRINPT
ncbi:Methionyl-tRNA synthetase [Operophtera brumata]|uniref:Methionyl-tRNA synthetase n=1 Tax=Operophtera brumata TaxID=104452 RepID=A0A0L7LJB4_OPEBR|nr:Methionyl-tRNA synthetase [Operophtera brumata]